MSDPLESMSKNTASPFGPVPEIGQPGVTVEQVTVERHLTTNIECECGWPMYTEDEILECVNSKCEWYGQKFARPTVTLVRVPQATPPDTTFGQLTPE